MKKVLLIFLSWILIFSSLNNSVIQAKGNDNFENTFEFVKMLGIVSDDEKAKDASVSRAEFVDYIIKALNITDTKYDDIFSDVSSGTPYSSSICTAAKLGFINGNGGNTFNPGGEIDLNAAMKIMVKALGYDQVANAYGGFPIGYITVAKDIKLLSSVGSDLKLDFNEVITLLYNFLNSDLCEMTEVSGDNAGYERKYGKSLLTERFYLKKVEGVVRTAGTVSMVPNVKITTPVITVSNQQFDCVFDDAEKYLGKNAVVWYDEKETVRAVYLKKNNSSLVVSGEYIAGYSDYTLSVYNGNDIRTLTYRIDKSFTYVENGRNKVPEDNDFVFKNGSLELIDNNGDNVYDVVIAKKYQYLVVSGVNVVEKRITDARNAGKSLVLRNENGFYNNMIYVDRRGNEAALTIGSLATDDVIMYAQSADGTYTEGVATKKSISGVIDEFSTDGTVVIDGEEYKLNDYFSEEDKLLPGLKCTLLLAYDNTITAFAKNQENNMKYGYFLDYYAKKEGLQDSAQIAILTTTNDVIYPYLAEDVILDGTRVKCTDTALKDALINGDVPKYQVIKYEENEELLITKIDTSVLVDANDSAEEIYGKDYYGDDTLTKQLSKVTTYYNKNYAIFSPHAYHSPQTNVFVVPQELVTGVTKRFDEKYFTANDTSFIPTYVTCQIDAFDMSKTLVPNVVVMYYGSSAAQSVMAQDAKVSIVEKCVKGINEEGENVHILYAWNNGKHTKYIIDSEVYEQISKKNMVPCPGDVIQLGLDINSDVTNISIIGKYNSEKKMAELTAASPNAGQGGHSCYTGTVLGYGGQYMSVLVNESAGHDSNNGDTFVNGVTLFQHPSSVSVVIFDTEKEQVRTARTTSIEDAFTVGRENASKVFIKCYTQYIDDQIIIYK